ncbi:DUF4386 domain-containing protein [Salmonirosea aquatica]|uniref:DUF4386 family protein n=1 Tax=Salmonirosea aquatica TaxID=2654236 RepID=A0A7C9FQF4_9BACT|nr:DUF4386 family protein [Cytophagaceae bacterium SJW1-29]
MTLLTRKYALISGLWLIAMAVAAGYAYGYVYNSLVVADNPAATLENIRSSLDLFMSGIIGWIVIFLLDILVAWGLYHFLKEVHPGISLATALVRVVYALILGAAILHLFTVVNMVESTPSATQLMDEPKAFESLWSQGLILFGVHLFGLGILTLRARPVPNLLGYLLLFAGLCYTGLHLAKVLAPVYLDQIVKIEMVLSLPMALAEIGLAFWLILKGGKMDVVPSKHS